MNYSTIRYYKVRKGDTLYGISKKFKASIKNILAINRFKSKNRIRAGIRIKIPLTARKKNKYRKKKKTGSYAAGKGAGFIWPIKHIHKYNRDGLKGVKSIGLIIKGRTGSKVLSSAAGIVKKIGWMRGFGKYIIVLHKNSFITVYSKLGKIYVSEGTSIKKGDVIGKISRKKVLHFQISRQGKSLNPLKYLRRRT